LQTLTGSEHEIIKARTTGVSLRDLSEDQIDASLTGILFKVSVISGCTLPTHDAHIEALEKEFGKFLIDNGYDLLTNEELLTAFRFNAAGKYQDHVESYGHLFNLDYAGKVLRQYMSKRYKLDNTLSDMHRENETAARLKEDEDKRRRKIIEQYNKYLENDKNVLDLSDCYMQLNHDKAFLDTSFYTEFLDGYIQGKEINEADSFAQLHSFGTDMFKRFSAEKKAVGYLFFHMKKSGKIKVYDENLKLLYPYFESQEKPTITIQEF